MEVVLCFIFSMKQRTKSLEEMKDGGGVTEDLKREEIPFMSPNELVKHCVIEILKTELVGS